MTWSCAAVRRRLAEYHDGELTIDQRVAVQGHLRACPACAAEAQGLNTVAVALRAAAARRAGNLQDLDGLAGGIVSRLRAEREESFPRTLERMFEDLHLVWAALSATAATLACMAIMVGIFYVSRAERSDSLAALIDAISNPGSNANPVQIDERTDAQMILPRQDLERLVTVPEMATDDEIMLTREGRVASLQLMNPDGPTGQRAANDWKTVGAVLDSVAQARFEPARFGGEPVAVKMFWYLTHTTVRPKAHGAAHRAPAPVAPTHIAAPSVV
jgi:AcrR family transcriptional regulator